VIGVLVEVARTDEIPVGEVRRYVVEGREIAIVNLGDGDFRAVGDICSHAHYHLSEGEVDVEDATIECWKHGSTFDLATGRPRTLPATAPIPTYPVKVEGETIMIELRDDDRDTDG
jgi:3-phenylpropionate/trans-cinnamate dioxygenase ferredoxin subunit